MFAFIKKIIRKILCLLHIVKQEAVSVQAQVIPIVAKVEAVPQEIKKEV